MWGGQQKEEEMTYSKINIQKKEHLLIKVTHTCVVCFKIKRVISRTLMWNMNFEMKINSNLIEDTFSFIVLLN